MAASFGQVPPVESPGTDGKVGSDAHHMVTPTRICIKKTTASVELEVNPFLVGRGDKRCWTLVIDFSNLRPE